MTYFFQSFQKCFDRWPGASKEWNCRNENATTRWFFLL